jgi:hypothetical protein
VIAFTLNEEAAAKCRDLGLSEPPMFWWGALPCIQRVDAKFNVFTIDRREALAALTRRSEADPSSLSARDSAFYHGCLAELVSVVATSAEVSA